MNNLHLTHTDIRSDSRILKEMEALHSAGYSVFGIGVRFPSSEGESQSHADHEFHLETVRLATRRFVFLPSTVRHAFAFIELFLRVATLMIRTRPHIVHCHDVVVLPIGILAKLLLGVHLVYDAHELESERNGLSRVQSRAIRIVERQSWHRINALIVVSESIGRWYERNLGKKRTEIVLNSPVQSQSIPTLPMNYLRKRFGIPSDSRVFIYIGLLGPGRGIENLIEVFSSGSVVSHLVCLGFGPLSAAVKEASDRCDQVHYHESVPHEMVVSVAQSADVGLCFLENVSLSDYYALPNKLFEFAFAGIPVLASDFPEMARAIRKYTLGWCSDNDTDGVRNAIQECERLTDLPAVDLARIEPLGWDAQALKLKKLYLKLS